MPDDEREQLCMTFLNNLKGKSKGMNFDNSISILQDLASRNGISHALMDKIIDVIVNYDLGTKIYVTLIKCLIPIHTIRNESMEKLLIWFLYSIDNLTVTVSTTMIQWLIGVWTYRVANRRNIYVYYDWYFFQMVTKLKLELQMARLVYMITKPQNVSRLYVLKLLGLRNMCSKPPRHIVALLSLFKSYKPELVPEKIPSVNVENVQKPIPESIRLALEDASHRAQIHEERNRLKEAFNWDVTKAKRSRKAAEPLIPSVGYFQLGSSIFKEKDTKSIFDLNNLEDLGKYHPSLELPSRATALLANTAGYHLLTFADYEYQSRFSCNLYNTLRRAFIIGGEKISKDEISNLLDMTIEFSRYMNEGIPVVHHFFDQYFPVSTRKYTSKFLTLLSRISFTSVVELQTMLYYLREMIDELSPSGICEIIETLTNLARNMFVKELSYKKHRNVPNIFLRQNLTGDLANILPALTDFVEEIVTYSLIVHDYDVTILHEALMFYEELIELEKSNDISLWTVAPAAVIYGGMVSRSAVTLSRVCGLLISYREVSDRLKENGNRSSFKEQIEKCIVYVRDITNALFFGEAFSKRRQGNFLDAFPQALLDEVKRYAKNHDMDLLLGVNSHFALLLYICIFKETGLDIVTSEEAIIVSSHYYPKISEFYNVFQDIS